MCSKILLRTPFVRRMPCHLTANLLSESRSSTMLYLTEWLAFTEGTFLHALLVFLFQDVAKPEEPIFGKGMTNKPSQPNDSDDEEEDASEVSKIPLHYLLYKAVLSPDIEMVF